MRLSEETIKMILGINDPVYLTPRSMIDNITVTFFPFSKTVDRDITFFSRKLKTTLEDLGVNVIPYREALGKHNRVRKGIAVIATGEGEPGNLPIDHVTNPRDNPLATIVKVPYCLAETTPFEEHMNIATRLFAQHMTNVIICLDKNSWMVYSLNGHSPLYEIDKDFSRRVLRGLIPKLATPLRPPLLSEFKIKEWDINRRSSYEPYIMDIVNASRLFKKTALYPPAKAIKTLPFRTNFYKKVGNKYLDRRSGMSYGFFARQLPTRLSKPISYASAEKKFETNFLKGKDCFVHDDKLYISMNVLEEKFCLSIPEVWTIITRSGCEKTDIDPYKDLIKVGLIKGQMIIEVPPSISLSSDYRPSFDTRLILSHAVAHAIYGSILAHFKPNALFPKTLSREGMALAHWHGYIQLEHMPKGWYIYGISNPAVCCSTHEAAIYAFRGKEEFFIESLFYDKEYSGDIHIERHHGINVTYGSLVELAKFILLHPKVFKLGVLEVQKL